MNKKMLSLSIVGLLCCSKVFATPVALPVALPAEDGGMLALAAAGLALGISIIRRKRHH